MSLFPGASGQSGRRDNSDCDGFAKPFERVLCGNLLMRELPANRNL